MMAAEGALPLDNRAVERALGTLGWSGDVRFANTFFERLRGFSRPSLGEGEGGAGVLVFPYCRSVHTCGMRFDLDIAFADADGEILRHDENVGAWRLVSCPGARFTLERRSPMREARRVG